MKIALISDIHSNHTALHAVLADIETEKVDAIYNLGDMIGYFPEPDRIFPIIRENGIQTIMGNYEEAVAFSKDNCGCEYQDQTHNFMSKLSFNWTVNHTSTANKDWMKTLPREIRLNIDNRAVLMVHGSPDNISSIVDPNDPDEEQESMLAENDTDILFCGHTHWPFHKIVNGRHIVNPGSVGRPRIGSPQANYAVVDLNIGCLVRFRFIDYNYESFAREIEESSMPENNFAEVIRTGYWKF